MFTLNSVIVSTFTSALHCCVNAVFCGDADALWWLQWGPALWLLLLLLFPLLSWSALQRRVAGVGVVGVFTQGAGSGAEDEAGPGQEGSPQQGQLTAGAAEAGLHRVPVLALVRHLALVDT